MSSIKKVKAWLDNDNLAAPNLMGEHKKELEAVLKSYQTLLSKVRYLKKNRKISTF